LNHQVSKVVHFKGEDVGLPPCDIRHEGWLMLRKKKVLADDTDNASKQVITIPTL
jgi:hypothetical protein